MKLRALYHHILVGLIIILNILVQHGFSKRHWQLWTLLAMLMIILIGQFIFQPMMAELKAAGITAENKAEFGRLHGMASVLFLINSLAGLALVVSGLDKKA